MEKAKKLLWQAKMTMKTNWLSAREILENGTRDYPEELDLYIALGDLYMKKELHKKAIENYQKALKIAPKDERILFKNGNCLLMLDEFRLALDQYNLCETDFPELTYNKAFAYYKLGKIEQSIDLMKEIVKLPQHSEMPLIFITELSFIQRDYKAAIYYMEKAEKRFGRQGNLQYLKGLAYFHQQNWLKAFLAFQKADRLNFSSSNFLINYGIVANKIGKDQLSENILLRNIELHPNDGQSYAELINLYLEHDNLRAADKIAQQAKKNATFSLSLSMAYNKLDKAKRKE
ncbi:MAG: tetratricopeptide repeat protein [Candidatus Cloacimonadales bacterium]